MSAYLEQELGVGTKIVTVYPKNIQRNLPNVASVIILNDVKTGMPLAFMDGTAITTFRTGAAGGVAAKYLARADAKRVAVIGTGVQGRIQLEALCNVREVEEVRAYSPTQKHRELYVKDMKEKFGIDIKAVDNAKDAVLNADLIITATTSKYPVLNGKWLSEGTHINAIGSFTPNSRELDDLTIKRVSKIVVDSLEEALLVGDLAKPVKLNLIRKEAICELGEIVARKKEGRKAGKEITLFKSVGIAVLDIASALAVYKQAKEKSIGKEVALF
jgi:alanine dehydrogenase